jgi:hypothetical protein
MPKSDRRRRGYFASLASTFCIEKYELRLDPKLSARLGRSPASVMTSMNWPSAPRRWKRTSWVMLPWPS